MEPHAVAGQTDLVFLSSHFLANAATGAPSGEGSYGGTFWRWSKLYDLIIGWDVGLLGLYLIRYFFATHEIHFFVLLASFSDSGGFEHRCCYVC